MGNAQKDLVVAGEMETGVSIGFFGATRRGELRLVIVTYHDIYCDIEGSCTMDKPIKFKFITPQVTSGITARRLLQNMLYNGVGQTVDGLVCLLTFGLLNTWLAFSLVTWISRKNMKRRWDEIQNLLDETGIE